MKNDDLLSPIFLDGKLRASLDWSIAQKQAIERIKKGQKILWQMDLGLFSRLDMPLSHPMQLQALNLSLEHFRDTLWKEFQEDTLGLIIYSGNLDFSKEFPWNESLYMDWYEWLQDKFVSLEEFNEECQFLAESFYEVNPLISSSQILLDIVKLFCRDTAAEYLKLLTRHIPDSIKLLLKVKINESLDPLLFYQLTAKDRFERFEFIYDSMNQ